MHFRPFSGKPSRPRGVFPGPRPGLSVREFSAAPILAPRPNSRPQVQELRRYSLQPHSQPPGGDSGRKSQEVLSYGGGGGSGKGGT